MADKKKSEEINNLLVDKRLIERQIARGAITAADYEKHMAGLVDLADRADNIASIVYPSQG